MDDDDDGGRHDPSARDHGSAPPVSDDEPRGDGASPDTETDAHEPTPAEIHQAAALAGSRVEHLIEDLIETELETGRREETVEEAKRHIVWRIVRVVSGVVVLLLGIVLLVAPGPGLLVIALGLGLLAQDVPFARKLLDRVRARLPQDEDGKLPKSSIVMMVVVGVGAMAISIWFTFFRG